MLLTIPGKSSSLSSCTTNVGLECPGEVKNLSGVYPFVERFAHVAIMEAEL